MTTPAAFSEVLAKLRDRYAATAPSTLAAFSAQAEQLERAPTGPEVLAPLRAALHRVHGTAGSYGFNDASELAGSLELVVNRWIADPQLDVERRATIMRRFIAALGVHLAAAPGPDTRPVRRLLLAGLPDEISAPLVTEGLLQGYLVERTVVEGLPSMLVSGPPRAVLASARIDVAVPGHVPLVLLRVAGEPVAAHAPHIRVVDATTDPGEVLRLVAEQERGPAT